MGISDFYTFLEEECSGSLVKTPLKDLEGFTVPFDLSLYLFKFKALETPDRPLLDSFFFFIHGFMSCGINLVAVKDGQAPKEKEHTQKKRREKKDQVQEKLGHLMNALTLINDKCTNVEMIGEELTAGGLKLVVKTLFDLPSVDFLCQKIKSLEAQSISITESEKASIEKLLEAMGIPLIKAKGEAEQMCAYMVKQGKANACLSDDSDVVACGCPYVLRKFDPREKTIHILSLEDVLTRLGLTYDQLLDFCILSGNDYNDRIPKFGPKGIYKAIKEYGTIENIPDVFKLPRINMSGFKSKVKYLPTADPEITISYKRVREIFTQVHEDVDDEQLTPKELDHQKVAKVLSEYKSRISDKLMSHLFSQL